MLKDDRMMSMLTFVVIMLVVGTMVQRTDLFGRYFSSGSSDLVLQRDEVIARANTLIDIDVLANDQGLREGDSDRLIVIRQPGCGRVFMRDQKAHYLPAERCIGPQNFEYAISGRAYADNGLVAVVVRSSEPTQSDVAANTERDVPASAPMTPDAAENVVTLIPSLLAAESGVTTAGNGKALPSQTVPRPRTAAVSGLPDSAPGGSLNGGAADAGVEVDDTGSAPSITAPADSLGNDLGNANNPGNALPDQDEPLQPATETDEIGLVDNGMDEDSSATIGIARVDPAHISPADTDEQAFPDSQSQDDRNGTNVKRTGPPKAITGGSGLDGQGEPAQALASIRGLGEAASLAPVDTTSPAVLSNPVVTSNTGSQPAQAGRVAALPSPAASCVVPPSLILEIRPAGMTEVIIDAPCNANTVAELSYDHLRLGVSINGEGAGNIVAFGFQQASDAMLRFADGETFGFNIPFSDTDRLTRVALVWATAVDLDLNAFEFGAQPQGKDHVHPGQPRSFDEVRRRGGGYLIEYQPVSGVGDNVNVYTYWRRRGGRMGVVKLKVKFASRVGMERPDTCGEGRFAAPDFTVLQSAAGKLERPRHRRLAPLGCAAVVDRAERYIADAVNDMIVLQR